MFLDVLRQKFTFYSYKFSFSMKQVEATPQLPFPPANAAIIATFSFLTLLDYFNDCIKAGGNSSIPFPPPYPSANEDLTAASFPFSF